jgi:hypothetical protein
MPTTITGAMLLILLAMPGIAYTAIRQLHIPLRDRSAFHEIASVAVASLVADIVAVFITWWIASCNPTWSLNTGELIADPQLYLSFHYVKFGFWFVGFLAIATGLSLIAGLLANWKVPIHSSTMSSWHVLLRKWKRKGPIHVGIELDDGSWVEGTLRASNTSAYDTADRDLILVQPLKTSRNRRTRPKPCSSGAICVSARRIRVMHVTYLRG